ncbi:MAG: hypothetical protein ACJ73S_13315 [Mycobacteriales bacterium]
MIGVVVVVAGLFAGVRLWTGHASGSPDRGAPGHSAPGVPTPEPSSSQGAAAAFLCMATEEDDPTATCERQAKDYARRKPLTAAQRARAEPASRAAEQALLTIPDHDQTSCDTTVCTLVNAPVSDTDVTATRTALANAGFPTAVVRLARPADPAAPHSLLFAIPLNRTACLVGYQTSTTGGTHNIVGPLPDNTCLDQ